MKNKYYNHFQNEKSQENNSDFSLAEKLPVITLDDVNLALFDEETKNKLSLNIDDFKADRIVLNKHFRIDTEGKILLNDKENIKFDIKASSFMPELTTENAEEEKQETEYVNFIKEFAKYNIIEGDLYDAV